MAHFRALRAWQEARRVAALSRGVLDALPEAERAALGAQWGQAMDNVLLNLADGAGTRAQGDVRRAARAARGALDELAIILQRIGDHGGADRRRLEAIERARRTCCRRVARLLQRLDAMR